MIMIQPVFIGSHIHIFKQYKTAPVDTCIILSGVDTELSLHKETIENMRRNIFSILRILGENC